MRPGALHVHIDRVVLEGFDGADARYAQALGRDLERELAVLLAEFAAHAVTPAGAERSRLQAPVVQVPYRPSPAQLGRALARSLRDCLATCAGSDSQGSASP